MGIKFVEKRGVLEDLVLIGRVCGGGAYCQLGLRITFDSMMHYKVGTGDRIKFWLDTWVGEASFAYQFPNLFHCATYGLVGI